MLIIRGIFEAIAEGIKVETFMISLVTKTKSKETREATMTGVVYMFLLEVGILQQLVMARCPWRT